MAEQQKEQKDLKATLAVSREVPELPRGPGLDQQFGENPNPDVLPITDEHLRKPTPQQERRGTKEEPSVLPSAQQPGIGSEKKETSSASRSLPTVVTSPQQEFQSSVDKDKGRAPAARAGVSSQVGPSPQEAAAPQILEKGLICFFYRPKVATEEVRSQEDVQMLFILLAPGLANVTDLRTAAGVTKRLIAVRRKELPSAADHERSRVYIDRVTKDWHEIERVLGSQDRTTPAGKLQHIDAARLCGEGAYALIALGDHTHLSYKLMLPEALGDVQRDFHISEEGSYIISKRAAHSNTPFQRVEHAADLDRLGTELMLFGLSDHLDVLGPAADELRKVQRLVQPDDLFKELRREWERIGGTRPTSSYV